MASENHSSSPIDVNNISEKIKELVHEGNVRKLIVRRGDEIIAEFPLTAAVVGSLLAPPVAAIGAIAALVSDCTIEVERNPPEEVVNLEE